MKEAMWALGMLVLGLFGVVLVNLFGNITVTDQLNYTTMKNTVEASMLDSLDKAHYRAGFCLCTNKEKTSGKWVFDSAEEYELSDIQYDDSGNEKCESVKYKTCEMMFGEYRLKAKTFAESLTRRFAEMVNNSKGYKLVIQDIIEYPPKVSVRVISTDEEFSPTEQNSGGYEITNQIDAIIETKKGNLGTVDTKIIKESLADETISPSKTSTSIVSPSPKATVTSSATTKPPG